MGNLNSKSISNDGKLREKPLTVTDYLKLCFLRKNTDTGSVDTIERGVKKLSLDDVFVTGKDDNNKKDEEIHVASIRSELAFVTGKDDKSKKDEEIDVASIRSEAAIESDGSESDQEDTPQPYWVKIDSEPRNERQNSDISEDSGFNEISVEAPKKKKSKTFLVPRGPVRHQFPTPKSHPYHEEQAGPITQISQIHEHIFSGGQVTVSTESSFQEADHIFDNTKPLELDPATLNDDLNLLCEFIAEDFDKLPEETLTNYMADAINQSLMLLDPSDMTALDNIISNDPTLSSVYASDSIDPNAVDLGHGYEPDYVGLGQGYGPPTPPTSEGFSPTHGDLMYDLYNSPSSSDNDMPLMSLPREFNSPLSPVLSSDPDFLSSSPEIFQDIQESTQSPDVNSPEPITGKKEKSLTQYKKEQTELLTQFKEKYCCKSKEPTKKFFRERLQAMESTERRQLCQKIAFMNFAGAHKVLQDILANIASESEDTNLLILVFGLIFQRVIAVKSEKSLPGLMQLAYNLLRTAALECYNYPIITQYLSESVRSVTQNVKYPSTTKAIFEQENLRNNLVVDCVRKGEECANVLFWLVRKEPNMLPLLDVDQATTDGYTALHVACQLHSEAKPVLHTVHVLMHHGAANIFKKEDKGGDTPLHLAVSSNNCDSELVMTIFSSVPQNKWFELTRFTNNGNISPHKLSSQLIKSRTNSSSHSNSYVKNLADIDNFFKRCRKDMGNK